jgi:hypothetical protein
MVGHPREVKRLGPLKVWQAYLLGAQSIAIGLVMMVVWAAPKTSYRYDTLGVHVTRPNALIVGPVWFGLWLLACGTRTQIAARKLAVVEDAVDEVADEEPAVPSPRPLLARAPLVPPPRLGDDPFREAPAPPPILPVQPRLARESPLVQGDPADRPKILT